MKNSIYSMYGVGWLLDNSVGINKSLGGTGIAFQSGRSINYLNPASYLGIPPSSIVLEFGTFGIYNKSANKFLSFTNGNINFSYFTVNLYLSNRWALSAGVVPFSFVDYGITSKDEIEGELTSFEKEYTGTGGLSRIYLGNSFGIYKGLSAGFNASYIVGSIIQTETALESNIFSGYEFKNEGTASSFYLDYGLQYIINDDNWSYTVGLIYGSKNKFNTTNDVTITYNDVTDSLKQAGKYDLTIPRKIGVGLSVKRGDNIRAGLDYEYGNWSNIDFADRKIDTRNSSRFSVGLEYTPANNTSDEKWYKSLSYRLGANYKKSYLEISNTQINSFGICLGIGIPFHKINAVNLSVEYGEEGTLKKGLIKNSYWMFYMNVSLHDLWLELPLE
ncbi:MAG: hypothetical protein JXA06_12905 [Bacteroidetes bacterium]|nr:hypothetical protein [Bacteroidota bacterium]